MVVDERLVALSEQAMGAHSLRLPDWHSLASEVQGLLGWESQTYIQQVISGQSPAASISDRQWLYWAMGIMLDGDWQSHCRYQPASAISQAA